MHTNVILTNKRRTRSLTTPIQNSKPGLGASYAFWPGNGVGLFYTGEPPDLHGGGGKDEQMDRQHL